MLLSQEVKHGERRQRQLELIYGKKKNKRWETMLVLCFDQRKTNIVCGLISTFLSCVIVAELDAPQMHRFIICRFASWRLQMHPIVNRVSFPCVPSEFSYISCIQSIFLYQNKYKSSTCWQHWRLYRSVTAATCVLIFSRMLSCRLTIFSTVYFHAPPSTASILRLFRPPSVRKCFSPNNASAVLPYAALAMVQRSCRWLTAALTIQLAASLIGLKSVGCIKVWQEEKWRILTRLCLAVRLEFADCLPHLRFWMSSPLSWFWWWLVVTFWSKKPKTFFFSSTDAPVIDVARFQ